MTASIEERVLTGAALLDRMNPGWESLINLDTLNVASANRCVLGQVYNGYLVGLRTVATGSGLAYEADVITFAADHGFSAHWCKRPGPCYCGPEFTALTAAWKQFIQARRDEVGASYIARAQERVMV